MVQIGERLPEATFSVMGADGPAEATTSELFAGKKAVLFATPGAYTPTCHNKHLPGFVKKADALTAKGVDMIACVSVNDVFVMDHWGRDTGASGKLCLLADGSGVFTKAVGLELDLVGMGLGVRSQRYAMIVEDGVVSYLGVEDGRDVSVSSVDAVLEKL